MARIAGLFIISSLVKPRADLNSLSVSNDSMYDIWSISDWRLHMHLFRRIAAESLSSRLIARSTYESLHIARCCSSEPH